MKLSKNNIDVCQPESDVYERLLVLDNKHILELGCGSADITLDIACRGTNRKITALEVDEAAHGKNLQLKNAPDIKFMLAGAQEIPLPDDSVDVVFMFKSMHHVPVELMNKSMSEIHRVLKPGGFAYISEPIFAGDFNEILRMFHDEENVRKAAFSTLERSVADGLFELSEELFFNTPLHFEDFSEFEENTIHATHSHHALDSDLYQQVKRRFESFVTDEGVNFLMPMRVDLLRCL